MIPRREGREKKGQNPAQSGKDLPEPDLAIPWLRFRGSAVTRQVDDTDIT
jgi:hypothetical protein